MTDPAAAIARTPRHPLLLAGIGVAALCAVGYRSLWTMSDRGADVMIRLLARRD